jgi:type I restriction enzyme R subunit
MAYLLKWNEEVIRINREDSTSFKYNITLSPTGEFNIEIIWDRRIINANKIKSVWFTLGEGGEQVYVQEYRERVERKVLELVESHPTIAAIRNGEAVNDLQLVALERTLRQELGGSNLQLTESNIRKAFNLQVGSLLGFLRSLLELEALSDYETVVQRNFEQYIAERQYNADQIQFLRAVQNVFLQKRRIEMADLYDEPLDRFGEDAVERWFTEQDVQELLALTERLAA